MRKVARLYRIRGHRPENLGGTTLSRAFIVEKEEELVVFDGTADVGAESIELKRRLGDAVAVVLPTIGIEVGIADELPTGPVKLVGARFGGYLRNTANGAPELGRVCGGVHPDLGDCLER